jgi:hypothetical protein
MQDAFRLRGTFIGKVLSQEEGCNISVKWPLLLLRREALANPKRGSLACGNSEMPAAIRVKG